MPMYLLARRIKAMGFKVVLSGEGADEIFGGYLYFHKAPSPAEFHRWEDHAPAFVLKTNEERLSFIYNRPASLLPKQRR